MRRRRNSSASHAAGFLREQAPCHEPRAGSKPGQREVLWREPIVAITRAMKAPPEAGSDEFSTARRERGERS